MEVSMYLVVASLLPPEDAPPHLENKNNDFFWAYDSEAEARKWYEAVLKFPDLFTVSLCVCLESTDYPTVKEVKWQ
jgi:hypothetical protein